MSFPSEPKSRLTLLVVGHGSRRGNAQFEELVRRIRVRWSLGAVEHAFIEDDIAPHLSEGLRLAAERSQRVLVLPVFLFVAAHLKRDLPECLQNARRSFPDVEFELADAVGESDTLIALARRRLRAALSEQAAPARTGVVVVGRGSSDESATEAFARTVARITSEPSFGFVSACYLAVAAPSLSEALSEVHSAGMKHVAVLPYLLFEGQLSRTLRERVQVARLRDGAPSYAVTGVLGADDDLVGLLLSRARTLAGASDG